jgi:hypothetical protein
MFGRKIHFSPVSRKRRKSLQNSDKMQRLSCVSKMLLTLYSWVPALALLHNSNIQGFCPCFDFGQIIADLRHLDWSVGISLTSDPDLPAQLDAE